MLNRLYNALAVVSIASMISGLGVSVWLAGSGRMDSQRLAQIAAILRGTAPAPPADPAQSAPGRSGSGAERPAPAPAPAGTVPGAGQSPDRARRKREAEQLRSIALDRAARDLAARQELLDQAAANLTAMREKFEQERRDWLAQQASLMQADRQAGFQREVQYVESLTPRLAKEHLLRTWRRSTDEAVRLLAAIDPGRGKRILEQFKTTEELEVLHELLGRLGVRPEETPSSEAPRTATTNPQP